MSAEDPQRFDGHEHVFVEEAEPSGRLVLPPCIVCGIAALDSLDTVRRERDESPSLKYVLERDGERKSTFDPMEGTAMYADGWDLIDIVEHPRLRAVCDPTHDIGEP